jgi:hypothetical protein
MGFVPQMLKRYQVEKVPGKLNQSMDCCHTLSIGNHYVIWMKYPFKQLIIDINHRYSNLTNHQH